MLNSRYPEVGRLIQTVFNPQVVLYPNPANGSIHMVSEDDVFQYKIFNVNAELLLIGKVTKKEFEIDLDLASGYYVIQLETAQGWYAQKFLIVK